MKHFTKFLIIATGLFFSNAAFALSPGEACTRRDRDPVKCMACAIKGEDNKTLAGMLAVGGVIKSRLYSGRFGSTICQVVHAPGQFVGAWGRLPRGESYNKIVAAARQSVNSRGNGFLGFRSYCRRGDVRIGKGGNCYRRTTENQNGGGLATDTPRDMALQEIEAIMGGRVQTAELLSPSAVR